MQGGPPAPLYVSCACLQLFSSPKTGQQIPPPMYHHVLYISPWLQFRMLSACGLDRRGFRGFTVTRGYCFWIGRRPGLAFRCRLGLVAGVGGDGEIEFPLKGCAYSTAHLCGPAPRGPRLLSPERPRGKYCQAGVVDTLPAAGEPLTHGGARNISLGFRSNGPGILAFGSHSETPHALRHSRHGGSRGRKHRAAIRLRSIC